MKTATKVLVLGLTAATLTLTGCGVPSEDESKKAAKERGFTVLSTGKKESYEGYASLPVGIDSTRCSASFIAASRDTHFLVIYGSMHKPLLGTRADKFYDPYLNDIKKLPQTAECYPDRK